jgi:hypothetical protein
MVLRSSTARVRWGAFLSFALLGSLLAFGCERDDSVSFDRNRPPETFITQGPENSTVEDDPTDLFYRAHLFWRGEDLDGTVIGFRFAIDDTNDPGSWTFTSQTDSVFRFPVAEVGSQEHLFLIRAVDDLGKQDPTPDTLRFESFTTGPPNVHFTQIIVNDQEFKYTGRDTVEVFSTITVCWTGSDPDGEIVGWESKFDTEPDYRFHARNDTCRTEGPLRAGRHTLVVRGIDDAGAKSTTVARATIQVNFDPVTTIDRSSIVSYLPRPWVSPTDTLWVDFEEGVHDTVPGNGFLRFCWSSQDIDGPVADYFWAFAGQGERTTETCVPPAGKPDSLLTPLPIALSSPGPLTVRARDVYGQAETPTDTVRVLINFAARVDFTDPNPPDIPINLPHQFAFTSSDLDSDPDSLEYQWSFDNEPLSDPVVLDPAALYVEETFTASQIGFHQLVLRAVDPNPSVPLNRSIPDTVVFNVIP